MTRPPPSHRPDLDILYQRIGEYLVSFQWLESRVREIGWLLLDPHRHDWPPKELRDLTNSQLLNRVRDLYTTLVGSFSGAAPAVYCGSFTYVINECHQQRRLRNDLLHSAFIELKGGSEVRGILRVNPRLVVDEDGQHQVQSEFLSEAGLSALLRSLGPLAIAVNMHHTQLIHWAPFDAARLDLQGVVAEFGVYKGGTTMVLSHLIERLGRSWRVIGFDAFERPKVRRSVLDMFTYQGYCCDESGVRRYLSGRNVEIVSGDLLVTVSRLETESVVLSFVDTDSYSAASAVLEVIRDRTVVGGAIIFDHFTGRNRGFRYTLGERLAAKTLLEDTRYLNLHDTGVFLRQR